MDSIASHRFTSTHPPAAQEELDRRESQIDTLSTQVQDLTETVATLRQELVSSHADNERVTRELDALRKAKTAGGDAPESTHHVAMATTIESLKAQLSTYQSSHADEVALRESLTAQVSQHSAIRTHLESEITHWKDVAQRETDSARNIQSILEEFQSDQEAELDRAVREYRHRLQSTQDELQRAQSRATSAENQYESSRDVISRAQVLEQECKEKNLLIGKLRHEAVILNEHLTEALKRLQRDSADVNVDRRLVSNVLLQFLTTPRQDAKRFEMLRLLGQVLLWNDDEREAAGLERRGGGEGSGRRRGVTTAAATKSAPASVQGDEVCMFGETCICDLYMLTPSLSTPVLLKRIRRIPPLGSSSISAPCVALVITTNGTACCSRARTSTLKTHA